MSTGPAPARPPRVVVVGSINADLLATVDRHPAPGQTVLGRSLRVLPGGKGANQAVAAARLGTATALVGAIGDDEFARPATAGLQDAGVDLSDVSVVDEPTGLALITVDTRGENAIVVVPGANSRVDAARVGAASEVVAGADVVVVQGEIPVDGIRQAARLARGRLLVNLAPVVPVDAAVLRAADPLVVNEHEAVEVLRLLDPSSDPVLAGPDDEVGVVTALREHGVRSVVLTLGPRGALVADGPGTVRVPSPRVDVVDTTGAGDAFVGALASRLATGEPLRSAAAFAARVGAFAVRAAGAQWSYPRAGDALPPVGRPPGPAISPAGPPPAPGPGPG